MNKIVRKINKIYIFYLKKCPILVLHNSIRGFPLKGSVFHVPTNYKGVVYKESRKPLDESTQRSFNVSGTFNKFTYWNYDKVPTANDALQKATDWADVSHSVSLSFKSTNVPMSYWFLYYQ